MRAPACNTYFTHNRVTGIADRRVASPWIMQFHVSSYRQGFELLTAAGATEDLVTSLESLTIERLASRRSDRQRVLDDRAQSEGKGHRKAGIQEGLNAEIERLLTHPDRAWRSQAALYKADAGSGKGYWTMDFHKVFPREIGVGVEVTFNHAEALPWTLVRPALAYQSDDVLPEARIEVGAIIIGTDQLKGRRNEPGGLRMDSAVGTYERLLTLLPRLKWVIPVPLAIFGLDWHDGKMVGTPNRVNLHGPIQPDLSGYEL